MFTTGITKIFQPHKLWGDRDKYFSFVTQSGYEAALWNGEVWTRIEETPGTYHWIKTPFVSSDFESQEG